MNMHYAANARHLRALDPICGYLPPDDKICCDARLTTCPECLDWVQPNHDLVIPAVLQRDDETDAQFIERAMGCQ
jgi:hypothetical protein